MSSPEVERFEVTEEDLHNEFNPNRKRFRMSKKRAMLGIWADSDDDDEPPARRGGSSRGGGRDYTAPIGFVSGGVKVGDRMMDRDENKEEKEADSSEDEAPVLQRKAAPSGFTGGRASSKGMGSWEKHTRGIGQKLLEKMGHVSGKGLGKNLQGISTPVEAFKRKDSKSTLGYHGAERPQQREKDFLVANEPDLKEIQPKQQQWKRTETAETKKKPKYVYKTADELLASDKMRKKAESQSDLAKVKVIDMTGREQRVLSGYHAIGHKHELPDEEEMVVDKRPLAGTDRRAFEMPELMHNLDLLVDLSEQDIINNERRLRYEKDTVVSLNHEKEKLYDVCNAEELQINKLKELVEIVNSCQQRVNTDSNNPLGMNECAEVFQKLQTNFYEEYKLYDLGSVAVALVTPLMTQQLEDWQPLLNPEDHLETVRQWQLILTHGEHVFNTDQLGDQMSAFDRLLWEVWMPHVRRVVSEQWNPREGEALIELLEAWRTLTPSWMMTSVLEQQVVPRLQTEVDAWDPTKDTMPIHAWLHPWLPLMGERLEPLYGPIRFKLSKALTGWHPNDPSAKMILRPWATVFKKGHMDAFLVKNIAPKLTICMQEFTVNPNHQLLDPWHWVMDWEEMLPQTSMVAILERHFFPKWRQVLSTWLSASPNYDEITKWYEGWKNLLSESLRKHAAVKEQLQKALGLMNQAVSGGGVAPQPPSRSTPWEAKVAQERATYDRLGAAASTKTQVPHSFKDLLERKAAEHNIIFVPVPNRTYEAKPVYRFGNVNIYMDRNVVFMQNGANWFPVAMNYLVDNAK